MFEEMRSFANRHTSVSPKQILSMATVNGARALGMVGKVGELTPRSFADLISIPYAGKLSRLHDAVLAHKGDVHGTMIDGEWLRGMRLNRPQPAV